MRLRGRLEERGIAEARREKAERGAFSTGSEGSESLVEAGGLRLLSTPMGAGALGHLGSLRAASAKCENKHKSICRQNAFKK